MKRESVFRRLLAVAVAVAMLAAMALPALAAQGADVSFKQVDNSSVSAKLPGRDPVDVSSDENTYADSDIVRVSIVLEKAGTIEAGYKPASAATNIFAKMYRNGLKRDQEKLVNKIEKATNEKLDVVWNLTLATNIISANVAYGQIEAIESINGVANVLIETRYEPAVISKGEADPNMATSGKQIGSAPAWAAGYTGAGSTIAVIDTGADIEHEAFDASAFDYSLSLLGKEVDLMDASDISAVLTELNAYKRTGVSAEELYVNSKIPFGFNYVDKDLDIVHLNDGQGEHGSHVAGIATANKYVKSEDGAYASALNTTFVQGVAPDAQLMVMKVFGKGGGAYDSDYLAAIEDAVLLGADSVNLSLGSAAPGMSSTNKSSEELGAFQDILNNLEKSGVVVAMSAGNSGYWAESAENGLPYLFLDDVNFQTAGSPGSYTNSLGIASVDNDGFVALYFDVAGNIISYTENAEYGNAPMTTLAGTQEYVLVDSIGYPEDFAAVGSDVLAGKIVMCYRGTLNFSDKANNAASMGAAGVVIVNNQPGVFGMLLDGYTYTVPAVSITQADGEIFKAAGTEHTTESGVTYWTGTMDVSASMEAFQNNSEYYTMSSFSSWGVPQSLILKPEITAPGGSIYSVAGAINDGTFGDHASYELMGGTSMASPQVAGMAALLGQYIEENGLVAKTGLDQRTLAQSLLMSTAVPLRDSASGGNYYPVIQQGAGLANVGAAIMADSYILMGANATASYTDGKVKAELGDDPEKTGVYSFSFTINNLTDVEKTFALSVDVFTQDAWSYSGILLLDTWTRNLTPDIAWTVNGNSVGSGSELAGLDFNGDGVVNTDDGQILLDYATGLEVTLHNTDKADLNADGKINSYDSYLFFSMLDAGGAVVPANGSAEVTVTITLSEDDRQWLAYYENGAYIEAFVYAESLSTAEGVAGTTHSIPVLGFYGNWSDASMFDKGSYVEYAHGMENRPPYLYGSTYAQGKYNGLLIQYSDMDGEYWFGGNPMVTDDTYMPERNAISAARGDKISKLGFTAIRNAADSYFIIQDAATGAYLMAEQTGGVTSAYYYVNGGYWSNTYYTLNIGMTAEGIPEGTALDMGLMLVPEYYMDAEGNFDISALGDGVTFSMPMVVDNTAPELKAVVIENSLMEGTNLLKVDVQDNQYIAAVALYDIYGQHLYTYTGSDADQAAGDTVEFALDLSEVNGPSFLLQVYDYAMNTTTYEITTQIGEVTDVLEGIVISETALVMQKGDTDSLTAIVLPVNAVDRSVNWSSSDESVVTVDANGNLTAVAVGTATVTATAVADETVTATCAVEVIDITAQLNGIVWDEEGSIWFSEFAANELPNYTKLSPDMKATDYFVAAAVGADGTLYASSLNTSTGTGSLYTIDPVTYEATKLSDCVVQGLSIFYSDLTYVPAMFGTGCLLGTYGPYVIAIDPASGEAMGIVDELDSELVGITTCYGQYDPENGVYQDIVYMIQNDGTVVQEIYYGYDGMVVPYMFYFYGERASFDAGVDVGSTWFFNSAYYDGSYLYWSAFDYAADDNDVELFAIDADYSGNVYSMGTFAEGVWPVGGLYQMQASADADAAARVPAVASEKLAIEMKQIQLVKQEVAAPAAAPAPAQPLSVGTVSPAEDRVTVEVTTDSASTNGVYTVTYDAEALTLVKVNSAADYYSFNTNEAGKVTVGFVQLDGCAADEVVATLVFEPKSTEDTSVTVTTVEENEAGEGADEELPITYPHANTEVKDAKDATCTEEGYTGDTYCADCGKLIAKGEVIPAKGHGETEIKDAKDATCTEEGYTGDTYCTDCGEKIADGEAIPAKGHGETEVKDAKDATCTEEGYTGDTYCTDCGEKIADGEAIPAKGHGETEIRDAKPATTTEEGYTGDTYCTDCGEKIADGETIAKVDPENPKTSEETRAFLMATAAVMVAAAAAVVVMLSRKKLF